jgi:uncharacterized RDD family membrane protein YckC
VSAPAPPTGRGPRATPEPGARRFRRRPGARPIRPTRPVVFDERTAYVGLVARSIAFVIDALIINGIAAMVTAGVGIVLSVLVSDPSLSPPGVVAGAAVFAFWSMSYFVIGWSVGGQTIGDAVMGVRVVGGRDGRPLRPCRAFVRFVTLSLGAIPFLAGFWILLWDRRRRAFHDRIARSVVVRVDRRDDAPAPIRSSG